MPETLDLEDEDTSQRDDCPFCSGGVVTVKGGVATHTAPVCSVWMSYEPRDFLRLADERRRAAVVKV